MTSDIHAVRGGVVGSGARLFEDMTLPTGHLGMHLDQARPLASGALELRYTFA